MKLVFAFGFVVGFMAEICEPTYRPRYADLNLLTEAQITFLMRQL